MVTRTYDGPLPDWMKPGLYLAQGDKIKALDHYTQLMTSADTKTPGPETLAASVAWTWAALQERADAIREIQAAWVRGEAEAEDQHGFVPVMEFPRIDAAVTLHGAAYYYKERTRGARFRLKWLDPATMEPDLTVLGEMGDIIRYRRTYSLGTYTEQVFIPAEDILRIYIPGMREELPWLWAGRAASLPGQTVRSILQTLDWYFETNGLPVQLISVPPSMGVQQVERLQGRLSRLFNRGAGTTNKTVGISGDVTITTLSLAPDQLDTGAITDQQREAIFAAFGVPGALVYKDVNRAESELKDARFVRKMAGRMDLYSRLIETDPDVARGGYGLSVFPERHEAIQRQELEKAEAVQRLAGRPVISVNEARERLELEPIPGEDYDVPAGGFSQRAGAAETQAPDVSAVNEVRAADLYKLRKFIAAGTYQRRPFKSDVLTGSEIAAEIERWEMQQEYTDAVKQFTEAMRGDD